MRIKNNMQIIKILMFLPKTWQNPMLILFILNFWWICCSCSSSSAFSFASCCHFFTDMVIVVYYIRKNEICSTTTGYKPGHPCMPTDVFWCWYAAQVSWKRKHPAAYDLQVAGKFTSFRKTKINIKLFCRTLQQMVTLLLLARLSKPPGYEIIPCKELSVDN